MEFLCILLNLALVGMILRGNLWSRVPYLSILATLSAIETPLLYWGFAHLSRSDYFSLFYGIDMLSITLTILTAIQLFPTQLRLLSLSMWVFLTVEGLEWYFLCTNQPPFRRKMAQIERPINLFFILIWAILIYQYTSYERRLANERTY
jgi:hypothetical protein